MLTILPTGVFSPALNLQLIEYNDACDRFSPCKQFWLLPYLLAVTNVLSLQPAAPNFGPT